LFECFLSTLYGAATADPAALELISILLVAIAVLVEKILRVQPDVKQIYLLIQPQGNATADQRLQTKVSQCQSLGKLKQSKQQILAVPSCCGGTCVHAGLATMFNG
jgi:hypothetical protein